ncbi:MAG TPA: enoyl-CoA hydratase-related protein [Acidimicrobiales bacterium]|nr:enoyl-CoA hydratase-related protein [Acidimicrobiales bacterium]
MSLRVEDDHGVRRLVLDRPDSLNAFDSALYEAVTEAFVEAASEPAIAVVVLTGSGRAFSSGADIGELTGAVAPDVVADSFSRFVDALTDFPKPLLCAVNGLAVGVGATLLAHADLVFMSATARLCCPFTSLGLVPEAGSSFLYPWLVGPQEAAWAMLSGEWLDAADCLRIGLAWKVVDPEDLDEVVGAHARRLASQPVEALVATKRLLRASVADLARAATARETTALRPLLNKLHETRSCV